MGFFTQIEGEAAILVQKGVYKQVDLYRRDGALYAKASGGFIKLFADGSTTSAATRLDTLSYDGPLFKDPLGRLLVDPGIKGAKALESNITQKLLGAAQE
jgi:hypothetical protein